MRLNRIYMLLSLTMVATLALMVWVTLGSGMGLYLALSQALVVITIILLIRLYLKTIKPLRTIISGVDLLNSQDFSTKLKHVNQRDIDHIVNLFNRLLQQLKDERLRVREKNEQLDILINASTMGVLILDFNNNITLINPSARQILECSDQVSNINELKGTISTELINLKMDSSKVVHHNNGDIFKCTHSTFVADGFKHSFYLIERMTEELLTAERKAYEQIIRMIAHEVNNSMAGVSSTIELVRSIMEEREDNSENRDIAKILDSSSNRCISLSQFISRLADVVKIPEPILNPIEVNSFIINNSKLYESLTMGRDIRLTLDLSPTPIHIKADMAQIDHAMLNIIKNSIEAIPQNKHGEIKISTSQSSNYLIISNNGEVISPDRQQNLFTPFYTTKPNGQGIGLMIIREVLTKHKFRFNLSTDELGITHFKIIF